MPEPYYEDKVLNCVDCKNSFDFTAGEQKYFLGKGLNQPKRCQACRDKRRLEKFNQEDQGNSFGY